MKAPCCDTLHTMGSQYLVNDITSFALEKGEYGIEYLDYKNLVDELIETEAELFD